MLCHFQTQGQYELFEEYDLVFLNYVNTHSFSLKIVPKSVSVKWELMSLHNITFVFVLDILGLVRNYLRESVPSYVDWTSHLPPVRALGFTPGLKIDNLRNTLVLID